MSAVSNTKGVFRWATGKRVVGLYEDRTSEHAGRIYVLVLDDGTGIAFGTGNGSHWIVSADDVAARARARRVELQEMERDLRDVLATEAALESQ